MVELRLSLLTAGSGQRVSTYRTLVNDKQCAQFFIRAHFCKTMGEIRALFLAKIRAKLKFFVILSSFCDLVHIQSVVDLFAK